MAKGKSLLSQSVATATEMSRLKPSTRFNVNPDGPMPKVGDMIECRVKGRVCSVEVRKDRYGDGKRRASVEIEHERDAVTMHRTGKQRSMAEMEAADEKV